MFYPNFLELPINDNVTRMKDKKTLLKSKTKTATVELIYLLQTYSIYSILLKRDITGCRIL